MMQTTLTAKRAEKKMEGSERRIWGNGVAQSQAVKPSASYTSNGHEVKSCRLCGGKFETLSGLCWSCFRAVKAEWGELCKAPDFELHLHEYIEQKIAAAGVRA